MKEFLVKKINPDAVLPTRATQGSAGLDLYACIPAPVIIKAGERAVVPTGIAIGIGNPTFVGYILARSGLGINHGISLSNGVGVIDSDYTGEITVGLINQSAVDYTVNHHDRIAQLVISPVILPKLVEVSKLTETQRGSDGFGSSGR